MIRLCNPAGQCRLEGWRLALLTRLAWTHSVETLSYGGIAGTCLQRAAPHSGAGYLRSPGISAFLYPLTSTTHTHTHTHPFPSVNHTIPSLEVSSCYLCATWQMLTPGKRIWTLLQARLLKLCSSSMVPSLWTPQGWDQALSFFRRAHQNRCRQGTDLARGKN